MTPENLRALPDHASVPDVAGDHLNAQRFLAEHGERLRRSPELGRWFIWNGAWWEEDRLDQVPELAANTIDNLRHWAAEMSGPEFTRRSRHYEQSTRAGRIDALLSVAGTDPDIVVAVDRLDAHPYLLACENGTIDLTTGELRPAALVDLLTRGVAVSYDPDAFSELWVSFLDTIFGGDTDLIAYVQRVLGYCLTGVVAEHIVPVLTGVGANGKSTLIGVVCDLLGDHAITAPEGLVIRQRHEPHPERLAELRGRRLVVSTELEQRAVLAEATVKMLTGGDTISARHLYGARFNFKPSHKVVLVTNHRPRVRGTDHAIWRRLSVVPFKVVIPADQQDVTLRRRLVEEHGPAVLAWLVEGAVKWNKEGVGTAEAVTSATEDYRQAEDVVGAWLDEHCTVVPRVRTKFGDLWKSWKWFCEGAEEKPGRQQDFKRALEEHGYATEKYQGANVTRGIGLLVDPRGPSSGNSPISTLAETVRTSPNEGPPEGLFENDGGEE